MGYCLKVVWAANGETVMQTIVDFGWACGITWNQERKMLDRYCIRMDKLEEVLFAWAFKVIFF